MGEGKAYYGFKIDKKKVYVYKMTVFGCIYDSYIFLNRLIESNKNV